MGVMVDNVAQRLYKAGKIKELYEDYDLFHRLTMIEKAFPGATILVHKSRKTMQAFRNLWSNEKLLNAVEQLVGPDISANPVWNPRPKTPVTEDATVPWHQDVGYMDDTSYQTLVASAWIPLLDTNETNGCMQVVKGGHLSGRVARHKCCWKGTWYVWSEEEDLEKSLGLDMAKDVVTVPVPYGGMLLFNNILPHRSLENYSDHIRWSLDLRWQNSGRPSGFYNIEGVVLRSSADPDLVPNWDIIDEANKERMAFESGSQVAKKDEFDTTMYGPWMKRWEIVNHNRHTDAGL